MAVIARQLDNVHLTDEQISDAYLKVIEWAEVPVPAPFIISKICAGKHIARNQQKEYSLHTDSYSDGVSQWL